MSLTVSHRPLLAATCVVAAMALLGLSDNLVVLVAEDAGLWQFHLVRSAMALPLIALVALVYRVSLRPQRVVAVVLRSILVSLSMFFYFGALAFVSVAQSAAGLFTAPIWVLLISFVVLRQRISALNVLAVAVGFSGVILVLQPDVSALSPALVLPVCAGILYAFAAIATRRYCAQENTLTLLTGFFVAILSWGVLGTIVMALLRPEVAAGADGFLLRGWVPMTARLWGLIGVQALAAVIGVGLITRGYLLAEAAFLSVFEYTLLIFGAIWGWMLWGQLLNAWALVGIALIIASGTALARAERGNRSIQKDLTRQNFLENSVGSPDNDA